MTYEDAEALLGKALTDKLFDAAADRTGCYLTGAEADALTGLLIQLKVGTP